MMMIFDMSFQENVKTRFLNFKKRKIRRTILEHCRKQIEHRLHFCVLLLLLLLGPLGRSECRGACTL